MSTVGSLKPSHSLKLLLGSVDLDVKVMLKALKLQKGGPEKAAAKFGPSKSFMYLHTYVRTYVCLLYIKIFLLELLGISKSFKRKK